MPPGDEEENEFLRYPQQDPNANYSYHGRPSDELLSFQQPQASYTNRYADSTEDFSYYEGEHPSDIFNTLHNEPKLARSSPDLAQGPFGDENYELGNYYGQPESHDQAHYHDNPINTYEPYSNVNFNQAFVPHSYEDDEEQQYDQEIQYNNFQGDHFDLQAVHVPDSPDDERETVFEVVPESPFDDNQQFPLPPEQEEVREKTKQAFASGYNGHLVLDCPVATELLTKFPDYNPDLEDGGLSREFAYMRYTAVTCGPSNFWRDGYILRPIHYPQRRHTEMMVVITMYNEDDILLARTLKGVFKNIKHLESKTSSRMWGKDSWKKIVVCIVSDGRSKINERAQALLASMGVYQEGLAKSRIDDKKVKAHMYEYTTRVRVSSVTDTVKLTTEKVVPVQMLFCLKETNAKKINSHRWCFEAISQVLEPNIVVLLDCGTQPSGKSLYHLWKEFDRDPQVAGACGEIKASLKKRQMLTNPLVYAQNFEYKISNILDKPTESVFGFISVLPGAFSAYRYMALQNDINGQGPLEKYFKGEFLHGSGELDLDDDEYEMKLRLLSEEAGIFTSNMYLAEDRILCYELVAKRGHAWLLRYVKSARAETDVPEGLAEFILQRRRWLNGSFFAAIYSLVHFPKIWTSLHTLGRKIMLHVEFMYQFVSLVVSWFSIGAYFLVFRILTTSLADSDLNFSPGNVLSVLFLWLYLASIVTTFVLSFGNKPKGTERFYIVIVLFFAVLMVYMIFAAIFMAVHAIKSITDHHKSITVALFFKNEEFRDLVVATCSTYLLYFVASFMYFEPMHMFTSFLQYLLLSPAYVNVLNIYAFCNIDDVSWGTKGDTGAKDLGSATIREDGTFDVKIPVLKEEINQSYLNQLEKIKDPQAPSKGGSDGTNEDYYAFIRSMTVLVWMFSNFLIVALVLETGGVNQLSKKKDNVSSRSKAFLTVILWTVAFMALFRFIGCTVYLIRRGRNYLRSGRSAQRQPMM